MAGTVSQYKPVTLWRGCGLLRLALLLGLHLPGFAHAASGSQDLQALQFAGRAVVEVVADYETQGHRFLYSTGLVRPSLEFSEEPPPGEPLLRLRQALQSLGLTLQLNGAGVHLIVRDLQDAPYQALRGRVLDADSGEPLVGVHVEIAGQVLTTDAEGLFQLPLQQPARIEVSADGYQAKSVYGRPAIEELLEIPLARQPLMDEIVVVSSRYAVQASERAAHHIDLALLESVPRLGGDPLRITGHLPGMATIGVSAKPHVRGGLQDELLVLFNNLELLEPFHLRDFQSVFSSFNPSVVQSIDVYTGGFPARYGDRMSGVMDIQPSQAVRGTGGELTVSLLHAGLVGHGQTHSGRGDWTFSARRGNLDIVTRQVNDSVGDPSYSDWFGQFRYDLDADTEIDLGFIAYNDDIELQDYDTDGEIASSRYRNLYVWAQLHRFWTTRLDSSTLVYYGNIDHDRDGFLIDEDLDNGEATVDDSREFDLFAFNQTINYAINASMHAEFGGRYIYQRGRYAYRGVIQRGELADFLGTDINEVRAYRLRPRGGSGGMFATLRLQPFEPLVVEAGLRWDFQDYANGFDGQLSPRLSLRYDVGEYTELRFSAGRFFQPEAIHELQVGDGITDYQTVQYADHYIAAWHQRFGKSGWSLRTELFTKRFNDPKARYENLFNPLVLLPELASDRVRIAPSRARARGVEATLRYAQGETLLAWLTYSKTETEERINGVWQPRAWDQGDTLSAGLNWKHGAWTVGATLLWHDGWRTTRLPAEAADGEELAIQRNAARLRDYMSLDLQISRAWEWPRQSLTAFVELTNVLSRRNVGGVEYDIEEAEASGLFEISSEPEKLLPLVPSIGIRWRF